MAQHGLFITFEGPDGTGKSTQIERLASVLSKRGLRVVTTREPGGTEIGERIRSMLLDSRTTGLVPRAELALMFASRAQHIAEVILPSLSAGKIVLCDRFTDSSEAYQGYARGLGTETVLAMHHSLCEDFQPDLTLLLMFADPAQSLARARTRNRGAAEDEARFEAEGEGFQQRVAEGYAAITRREPQRVKPIDAGRSMEEIHDDILAAVEPLLVSNQSTR